MKMPLISDVMTDVQSARMGGYANGYNDGAKSMQQEFGELLKMANRMWDILDTEGSYVAKEFQAWKKARGIE